MYIYLYTMPKTTSLNTANKYVYYTLSSNKTCTYISISARLFIEINRAIWVHNPLDHEGAKSSMDNK